MKKTFNNMWVVAYDNKVIPGTLQNSENLCQLHYALFLHDSWNRLQSIGYTCIRVNVTFEPVKP